MSIFNKRAKAYLLDFIFVYLLISLISGIKFLNPTYDKYMETYNEYNSYMQKYAAGEISIEEVNNKSSESIYYLTKYSVSLNAISIVVIIGYFVLFQKYNNGQTLGKKIMKIKVVDYEDKSPSIIKYLLRSTFTYYVLVGNIISLTIISILVFIVNVNTFSNIYLIITYLSLFLFILDIILMWKRENKCGLHDIISKTKVIEE